MTFEHFATLARARRTNMQVDRTRAVPDTLVDDLCELAMWAPNHRKTWPWRFTAFSGEARDRLGQAFVDDMVAIGFGDAGKRTKTRTKYTRTPTVLVVGCAAHEHPTFHAENRDAVAAGIQNILLGASAAGLASFWSTPPVADGPTTLQLCGFAADDRIIGVIYLGWPLHTPDPPSRPAAPIRHITD